MGTAWTSDDIPDQRHRVAVVTGANTGLGYETARVLAARGASVVLAVRSVEKGERAAARIAEESPGAEVTVQRLDLASLESIRAAAVEAIRSSSSPAAAPTTPPPNAASGPSQNN